MRGGKKTFDPYHKSQVICYVHFARMWHDEMGWSDMGLLPAAGGMLFYVSRDNPRNTVEYYFPYVQDEVEHALDQLMRWRMDFEHDELPSRDKNWRWTAEPCKWCQYKKDCKQDIRDDVEKLSDSHVLDAAKSRPGYNYQAIRDRVIGRWKGKVAA